MSGARRRRKPDRAVRDVDVEPTPERLRRGRIGGETVFLPDPDRIGVVRTHRVRRDADASVGGRLSRFKDLTPAQVAAAERLERDWALAQLEPRLVQALGRVKAPLWMDTAEAHADVLDARNRVQRARRALRQGGEEVVRTVEGIVMFDAPVEALGAGAYAGRRDLSIYVRTLLGVGLNLLAQAYGLV